MEIVTAVAFHVFYVFVVQGLLYLFYAAQIEKDVVNNFIATQMRRKLTETDDLRDLARVVLPFIRLPQTCTDYENKHWRQFLVMFLVIMLLSVVIISLIVHIVAPETPILTIAFWNLGIFAGIAVIEYLFFKNIVIKYSEVSLKDILETIQVAIRTDPKKIDGSSQIV